MQTLENGNICQAETNSRSTRQEAGGGLLRTNDSEQRKYLQLCFDAKVRSKSDYFTFGKYPKLFPNESDTARFVKLLFSFKKKKKKMLSDTSIVHSLQRSKEWAEKVKGLIVGVQPSQIRLKVAMEACWSQSPI